MEFSTTKQTADRLDADCVAVGVHTDKAMTASAALVDTATGGKIAALLAEGEFSGKRGATLMLRDQAGVASRRILLVGLGAKDGQGALDNNGLADAARAAVRAVIDLPVAQLALFIGDADIAGADAAAKARTLVVAAREAVYKFDQYKSKKDSKAADSAKLGQISLGGLGTGKAVTAAIEQGHAIADGADFARDLDNAPPNVCNPTWLADQSKAMAKACGLKVEIIDEAGIRKLNMGSFLAVAQGSEQPPKLIVLQHKGGKPKDKPVVLVGKGITFDTGGISLKPAPDMDEMKYDMCGAAGVIGTMKAVALMKLPLNVVAIVPTCENMPSGRATRPGDIVTSMSGQTIEILNTDAEGRLILCDALTYAEKFSPAAVVDVATLTGACVIALGGVNSGLFSSDDELADELVKAGRKALDPAWRMPLEEAYQDALKSPFADVANVGGRAAGSVTAACFLWRFAKAYPWAHLDIAGTAWKSGKDKSATGRPVGLLSEFLRARAQS